VDGLDDQIDALTGDTKEDLETSYDAIKDRRDKLKACVKDIRDVKKDQWSTWRMEVNRTFETLEADVNKLEQQIKSGKTGPS
jgi:cell division protein FtsB